MKNYLLKPATMASTLLASGFCALILYFLLFYGFPANPKIVTVDLQSMTTMFIQQLLHTEPDQQVRAEKAKTFATLLETSIKHYAKEQHAVVLVNQASLAGAEDVTAFVENEIAQRLKVSDTANRTLKTKKLLNLEVPI
jgi:hypothetical protein